MTICRIDRVYIINEYCAPETRQFLLYTYIIAKTTKDMLWEKKCSQNILFSTHLKTDIEQNIKVPHKAVCSVFYSAQDHSSFMQSLLT